MSFGILIFALSILVVVMIHEAGHFFTAKMFDFKATKFFVGFGPTVWSFQKGETEYGLKALPLGGFVKIVGMNPYEEVPPEDRARSYPNKPPWQKAIVLVAGSATHWVVAFVLLLVAFMTIGLPTGRATTTVSDVTTTIGSVETPAGEAGLLPGDRIVSVDGVEASSWDQVSDYIKAHAGDEVTFVIDREGERLERTVTLGYALFDSEGALVDFAPASEEPLDPQADQRAGGFLGVSPEAEYRKEGLVGAAGEAGSFTWDLTTGSFAGIGRVFGTVVDPDFWGELSGSQPRSSDGALGIVGASRIAGQSVEKGRYLEFIGLIASFTVFVGLMNLLPLPPLDGGHLAVVAYEKITGRTVDVRKLIPVAAAVISFFVLLFLAVLYLDISNPLDNPF